jgi:tRNA threonylcarbamoyladenosine biosynthesis protein TsaE
VSEIKLTATGADETRALGARLAQALIAAPREQSLLLTLSGDLGAGKTTFVAGLLAAMGHVGPVRSPTYTLIEPYRLQQREILHCDLYRLRHPDVQTPGSVLLVEWPERAAGRLGPADLELTLAYATPDARSLRIAAPRTAAGLALLAQFVA